MRQGSAVKHTCRRFAPCHKTYSWRILESHCCGSAGQSDHDSVSDMKLSIGRCFISVVGIVLLSGRCSLRLCVSQEYKVSLQGRVTPSLSFSRSLHASQAKNHRKAQTAEQACAAKIQAKAQGSARGLLTPQSPNFFC